MKNIIIHTVNPENFVTVHVSDLIGEALDFLIAKDLNRILPWQKLETQFVDEATLWRKHYGEVQYSKNIELSTKIMDLHKIDTIYNHRTHHFEKIWTARKLQNQGAFEGEDTYCQTTGPTRVIAALRCRLLSLHGNHVSIPELLWTEAMPKVKQASRHNKP